VPNQGQAIFARLFSAWVTVAWGHKTPDIDFIELTEQITAMTTETKEQAHEA
jgi:hypothetical protein